MSRPTANPIKDRRVYKEGECRKEVKRGEVR
jgi:hypothetical protein